MRAIIVKHPQQIDESSNPPRALSQATPFFVECQGHRLACLAHPHPSSDLQPVVWIHGLTGSVNFWEAAMYPEIYETRSWYSVSLPHHYPSTFAGKPSTESLNEYLLADLIHAAVEKIPGERLHLVGYSVGGFAAMNYAAKYPERVASVVSVGGFMTGRARGIEGVLQFFARGTFFRRAVFHTGYWTMQRHRFFFKLATLAYARKWRTLLNYHALDPTIRNIFPDVRNHSIEGQRAWFRYLLDMNLLDETVNITCPILVIAGNRDPIIPFRHQERYAALLPNSKLVVLPGVGHVAFGEVPDLFKRTVLEWLRSALPPADRPE